MPSRLFLMLTDDNLASSASCSLSIGYSCLSIRMDPLFLAFLPLVPLSPLVAICFEYARIHSPLKSSHATSNFSPAYRSSESKPTCHIVTVQLPHSGMTSGEPRSAAVAFAAKFAPGDNDS